MREQPHPVTLRCCFAGGFVVGGELDGCAEWARCADGVLQVSPELLARAQLLVDLGERFELAGRVRCRAGIGADLTATQLTLLRALDVIHCVEVELPRSASTPVAAA